jgi:ubiquinone/menaquinone biosynthesis C-methylase UbiE
MEQEVLEYWDAKYKERSPQHLNALPPKATGSRDYERVLYFSRYLQSLEGKHILDIGCGANPFVLKFFPIDNKRYQFYGVDISLYALNSIPPHPAITKIQADVLALPFNDNSMDIICIFGTLMYVDDYQKALEEISRVLKPGGVILGFENIIHRKILKNGSGSVHDKTKLDYTVFGKDLSRLGKVLLYKKNYSPFRTLFYRLTSQWFEKSRMLPMLAVFLDHMSINTFGRLSSYLDGRAVFFVVKKVII